MKTIAKYTWTDVENATNAEDSTFFRTNSGGVLFNYHNITWYLPHGDSGRAYPVDKSWFNSTFTKISGKKINISPEFVLNVEIK